MANAREILDQLQPGASFAEMMEALRGSDGIVRDGFMEPYGPEVICDNCQQAILESEKRWESGVSRYCNSCYESFPESGCNE